MLADFYNEELINKLQYPINGVDQYQIKYCDTYEEYLDHFEHVKLPLIYFTYYLYFITFSYLIEKSQNY